jgi:serine/threonine protein kinase
MAILEDRDEIIARASVETRGEVFKGRDKSTGDSVALKRIKNGYPDIGFPMNSMPEITFLRSLNHPNIIHINEVQKSPDQDFVYLIFEYCQDDLWALLVASESSPLQVRCYLR